MPLVIGAGGHSDDDLPGERGSTVAVQYHLPVVDSMGEDRISANADPRRILTDANSVTIIGKAGLRVLQISIP